MFIEKNVPTEVKRSTCTKADKQQLATAELAAVFRRHAVWHMQKTKKQQHGWLFTDQPPWTTSYTVV